MNFRGTSLALTDAGLNAATTALNVAIPEIWAVLSVETKGCGYLADGRPQILFERHYFSRLTNGKYDASHPDISAPSQGGYGAGGAHQYDRLAGAYALDPDAALQSASWGMGQIMGANHTTAGFPDANSMVAAMMASEDAQLSAIVNFLIANRFDKLLAAHNWTALARGYNGPTYAQNEYDKKLAAAYDKLAAGPLPDLRVRAVQMYLHLNGFDPKGIDGVSGPGTQAAVKAFQASKGLPATGVIDDDLLAALTPAEA